MYRTLRKSRKQRGFTLIELLVVIAVIGILAAIALPKMFSAICKGKVAQANGIFGSINSALSIYFADSKGVYPKETAAGGVVLKNTVYFAPTYMNVPEDPWEGGGFKYQGTYEIYTLSVFTSTLGCDGELNSGDEYLYYSSYLGTIDQTSTDPAL